MITAPDRKLVLHLAETFDQAARASPDLFEPYLVRLEGADENERVAIMREGLRETFTRRHPNPFAAVAHSNAEDNDR